MGWRKGCRDFALKREMTVAWKKSRIEVWQQRDWLIAIVAALTEGVNVRSQLIEKEAERELCMNEHKDEEKSKFGAKKEKRKKRMSTELDLHCVQLVIQPWSWTGQKSNVFMFPAVEMTRAAAIVLMCFRVGWVLYQTCLKALFWSLSHRDNDTKVLFVGDLVCDQCYQHKP